MKKILIVDDSALMRRVLCDIINCDSRFRVADTAVDGVEALELLKRKMYDAVVLDVYMPRMDGLQLLRELRKQKISAKVLMVSVDTLDGAKVTLDALELGAIDFIHKPESALQFRSVKFRERLLETLAAVAGSSFRVEEETTKSASFEFVRQMADSVRKYTGFVPKKTQGRKIVAIASSTGGPKALQSVIPGLPSKLNAPVLVVQHMPAGFTASLAERLDDLSSIRVKEAEEGEVLQPGCVYISRGGVHMNVSSGHAGKYSIHYTDQPSREGVKPCSNYMYESLIDSEYDEIICVVLTGMGADATEGIKNLKAAGKKVWVIAQDRDTCAVYGMPRSVVSAELSDKILPLDKIAQEITANTGVM